MVAGRRAHMTFELNGSGGTVVFDLERLNSLWVSFPQVSPTRRRPARDPRDGGGSPVLGAMVAPRPLDRLGRLRSVHDLGHFLTAVHERKSAAPLGATFEDGYRCAVVVDAILEAARSGRRVVAGAD